RRPRDREPRLDDAPVVDRHARAEAPAGLEPRPRLPEAHRPRHPDRAELLRVALMPAASQGEVLLDPDRDAPRVAFAAGPAAHDEEALLVLGADRVEQLLER